MSNELRIEIIGGPHDGGVLRVEAAAPPEGKVMTLGAPSLGITGAPIHRRSDGTYYLIWDEIHDATERMLDPEQVAKLRRMLDELGS